MLYTHLNTSVRLSAAVNVSGYYVSNHRCIYSLCHVPCDLQHVLYTRTHNQSVFALQQPHTGERRSTYHCHAISLFNCASKHISKPLQSMMHTSIEHVILCCCVVLYCVFFSAVFTHISLRSSLSYLPLGPFCMYSNVNELNRSSKKTEPNQIDALLYCSITA